MLWYVVNPMIIAGTTGGALSAAFRSGRQSNILPAVVIGLVLGIAGAYIHDWLGGLVNSRTEKMKPEWKQEVSWALYWLSALPWIGINSIVAFAISNLLINF